MAKFTASKNLLLQDDKGVWADFTVGGTFETEDSKVIGRLRKVDGVTEIPEEKPAKIEKVDGGAPDTGQPQA